MSSGAISPEVAPARGLGASARNTLFHVYVGGVFLGAFLLFALLLVREVRNPRLPVADVLFFVALGFVADRYRIKVSARSEVSAGFLADFLSGALPHLGPFAAVLVSSSALLNWYKKGELERNLFHWGAFVLCSGLTSLAYKGVLDYWGKGVYHVFLSALLAGTIYQILNAVLFIPVAWIRRGLSPYEYIKDCHVPFLPYHYFFLLLSLGFLFSFEEAEKLTYVLFIFPLLGLIYAFRTLARERELVKGLERFSLQIVGTMITALDMKDNYTARHSAAVAQYSQDIARSLGLSSGECRTAHVAGLLHDLGKISVPDVVLNQSRRLEDNDWAIVKQHPEAGRKIVSTVSEFEDLAEIILSHHERYDGTGYPYSLAGERIPLLSRIISVADAYSAMISDRPYRKRLTLAAAKEELIAQSGTQFDPLIVRQFVCLLEEGGELYRSGGAADFRVEFQKVRLLEQVG